MSRFGSFWSGPRLSAFEASCLHSFADAGHQVTLYTYAPLANVPASVRLGNAADIADKSLLSAFRVNGATSISHFSDYFRYVMFARTELTWIDTDVLLLRSWEQDPDINLLALEAPGSICNAVMRIGSGEPWLDRLIAGAEALKGKDMRWGDTGPRLVTRTAGAEYALHTQPPSLHFPIHFDEFWKTFLPRHAAECRERCAEARTLHLWNNIVERLGFWKDFMPPAGSYLHELFLEKGCAEFFRGVFPERNMTQLVENWQSRQSGRHLGIGSVVRQFVPSIGRSYRHFAG